MLHDEKLDADTLVEMWELRDGGKPGSTGNDDAKYLAKTFADYAELSRTEANRLGASIGKLDGWAGVQTHDPVKMIQAGKDAWIGRIVTLLDHERTFPEGLSQVDAANALGSVYDTLITGIPSSATPAERGARVNPANLAKSLGASRVLHFQDAKAALAYRAEFGYGNTIAGMFEHLRHMSNVNGAMETLGPNPEVMFEAIAATLQREIRDSTTIPPADKPKLISKLKTDAGTLRQAIDVATGLATRPVNVTTAKIGSDIRALESVDLLAFERLLRAFAEQEGFAHSLLSDFWPHGAVSRAYGVFLADRGFWLDLRPPDVLRAAPVEQAPAVLLPEPAQREVGAHAVDPASTVRTVPVSVTSTALSNEGNSTTERPVNCGE